MPSLIEPYHIRVLPSEEDHPRTGLCNTPFETSNASGVPIEDPQQEG